MASNYLYYMKQNGVFDKIKGIWLGNYAHESGISLEEILLDTLGYEFKGPIIKSENFGHIDKKTVIPIGIKAKIDTNEIVKIKQKINTIIIILEIIIIMLISIFAKIYDNSLFLI